MTEAEDARDAVRMLARTPALLSEARVVLPYLVERAKNATAEEILTLIMPLKAIYGIGERSEEEWAAYWGQYLDALSDLPREALAEAVILFNRGGSGFFPKPSEIHKLAEPIASRLRAAAWRARKATEFVESKAPVVSEDEKAQVRAMMAADRAAGRWPPRPNTIPPIARPNGSPQQMAEALRRQAAAAEPDPII